MPSQTDTVIAHPLSDANWGNGISRARAGFIAPGAADLAGIQPGQELQFAHSGVRRVERVLGRQVWVSGPTLDPDRDGPPNPIRLASEAGLRLRRRFGAALRAERVLTARTPNANLLWGIDSIGVFDPVHNRRLKEFLWRHFDLLHPGFCLQPKPGRALDRRARSALQLLGASAVEGYRCAPDAGFVSASAQTHLVPDPLPAAFLVHAEALPAVRAAQAANDTAAVLRALHEPGAIHPLSIRRRGANRLAVSRPDQVPPGALLVVSLAYSRSWTLQGKRGDPFAGVLTSWPNPPAGRWRVRYWPLGLTAGLWLALAGLAMLAGVGWLIGRRPEPRESPGGAAGTTR